MAKIVRHHVWVEPNQNHPLSEHKPSAIAAAMDASLAAFIAALDPPPTGGLYEVEHTSDWNDMKAQLWHYWTVTYEP